MKRYFEYEFSDEIREKLIAFYDEESFMHEKDIQERGMKIKLERALKYVQLNCNDLVCDVGCSRGTLLNMVADRVSYGLGLDIAKGFIEENNRLNEHSNIAYRNFDGIELPTEKLFDKIFLFDVLEHSFEPDNLIKSIYLHLKNRGELIIIVPGSGWLSELLFGKYHMGHLRYYDKKYLCDYLQKFNFSIKASEIYNSVPYNSILTKWPKIYTILDKLCNIIPHRLYPYFGSILVVATREE